MVISSLCSFAVGCGAVNSTTTTTTTTATTTTTIPTPLPSLYVGLNFDNSSGLASNRIHIVINGYNLSSQWGYYDLSQDPAVFIVTNTMSNVPDTTLDTLISRGTTHVPYILSGRIYFGVDQRVSQEAADFTTPNSPTGAIYDKVEFSVEDTGNVINLTQVDYFNMPLKISTSTDVRGFNDGITRAQIFDEYLAAESSGWQKLVLTDNNGVKLRILNPAKIAPADAAYFSELFNYWDAIVNAYWANGQTVTILTDETVRRQITGTANGSQVDFGADGVYLLPTTLQMFGEAVEPGSSANIVKWLAGVINRGVIKNSNINDQADSTKYYAASVATNLGLYNYYSEFLHRSRYTINGGAYAIAFDDVFGQDSAITIPNQGTVTIKFQPFQ